MKKLFLFNFIFLVFQPLYSQQWQLVGLDSTEVKTMLVDHFDDRILYAGCIWPHSKSGLFKSADGGSSWERLMDGQILDFEIDFDNPNVMYVSVGRIFKSTDGGQTWFRSDSGVVYTGTSMGSRAAVIAIDPVNPDTLYSSVLISLAGGSGVYKSINAATSWQKVESLSRYTGADEIAIDPENNGTIYFGKHYYGELYKSTDFGETWQKLDFPAEGNKITSIGFFPGNSDKLIVGTNARGAIAYSKDAGITWELANTGLPEDCDVSDITFIETTPYITVYSPHLSGIFKSSMDSINWVPVGDTDIFKDQLINSLQYSAYYNALFAGTEKGVFSYSLRVKVESQPEKKPHLFQLKQNYPNPFNNSTVIEYKLKEPTDVSLDLYDINGKWIKNLVNESKAPGIYKAGLSLNSHASGVYFYKLRGGDHEEVKKLLLVK